eukprot:CAMPEP_0195580808 /NCGR_PEP_ID=MMETSP0814-20130614/18860_1 /TAXON_ID=97485 /ORGANISM="Prymnesium parvum, Strain Texoma1" /LENGTH=77 /DNA_ID=CAMNT_0040718027 /DNA_START=211 /DNA_END=444 /DNA_ORIENTATION=+
MTIELSNENSVLAASGGQSCVVAVAVLGRCSRRQQDGVVWPIHRALDRQDLAAGACAYVEAAALDDHERIQLLIVRD